MKAAYPVVLKKGSSHIIVFVPDFNINTQGKDMAEALEMAEDAIVSRAFIWRMKSADTKALRD